RTLAPDDLVDDGSDQLARVDQYLVLARPLALARRRLQRWPFGWLLEDSPLEQITHEHADRSERAILVELTLEHAARDNGLHLRDLRRIRLQRRSHVAALGDTGARRAELVHRGDLRDIALKDADAPLASPEAIDRGAHALPPR